MSYLNCPFCHAQTYPQGTTDFMLGIGLQRYVCVSKHVFYVEVEDKKIQEYLDRGIEPRDI